MQSVDKRKIRGIENPIVQVKKFIFGVAVAKSRLVILYSYHATERTKIHIEHAIATPKINFYHPVLTTILLVVTTILLALTTFLRSPLTMKLVHTCNRIIACMYLTKRTALIKMPKPSVKITGAV